MRESESKSERMKAREWCKREIEGGVKARERERKRKERGREEREREREQKNHFLYF